MAETNFVPNLGEVFEVSSSQVNLFRSIDSPGYVIGDIAITPAGATYEWDGDSWNSISVGAGGGAAQTPWAQAIDGGAFDLTNVGKIASALFGGDLVLVTNLSGEIEESSMSAGELGSMVHVAGAGAPAGAPSLGRGVAYNEVGNFWVYHSGAWQLQF